MKMKLLLVFAFVSLTRGNPEPAAEAKAVASPSPKPAAEPAPKAKSSPDAKTHIIPSYDTPFSVTPIPPFAHSPIYGGILHPTPLPPFPHPKNKIVRGPPSIFIPHGIPTFPHPKHPFHFVPHPDHVPIGHPLGKLVKHCKHPEPPLCSYNTTKPWCLFDYDYPGHEVRTAIQLHKIGVHALYADVADLSTENSVVRPGSLYEETYLCPSETAYVRPLRVVNTKGKWKIIVNNIKVNYDVFTQTARLEECLTYGKFCPLVPSCYNSKCVQKSVYHRFLIYDPCDPHFPFAIETFKLPASCSCIVGELHLSY